MRDISDFRDNFAKLNVRNLQKVPNRRRRNFGSELYVCEKNFHSYEPANAKNSQKFP